MAVALPLEHKVRFYASPDLKQWTQLSDFGPAGDVAGDWECPNLLRVPADKGGPACGLSRSASIPAHRREAPASNTFSEASTAPLHAASQPGAHGWTNYGKDDYCAISFNHLPPGKPPGAAGLDEQLAVRRQTAHLAVARTDEPAATSLLRERRSRPRAEAGTGHRASSRQPHNHHVLDSPQELKFDAPFELSLAFDHADRRHRRPAPLHRRTNTGQRSPSTAQSRSSPSTAHTQASTSHPTSP